jgi:Pyruvate/2-oxoglutarate dehydrogenase complex, dihydrolipoamide acyltransferase (E2) component, and related enzymes
VTGTDVHTSTYRRVPLSPVRRRTGERMVRAATTIPHASISVEVDYARVAAARAALGPGWRAEHGTSLTYLPFILSALCVAIHEFPEVNARLDGSDLLVAERVHLGIAVDLGVNGLVVPVIHDADRLSVADLALAVADLARRARAKQLTPADVTGATYTVTNPGPFGTYASAPIINPPQAAILAVDGIAKRPVVTSDGPDDRIEIRPMGLLTQAFDHRVFDGAYCAAFLHRLRTLIADTDWVAAFARSPVTTEDREKP